MEKTLGQINYETFAEARENGSESGVRLPQWADVGPDIQHAWEIAAKKVLFTFALGVSQNPEKLTKVSDELADALDLSGKWPKD